MNEHSNLSPTLAHHAALRAAERTRDRDVRCRRYRRWAVARRCTLLAAMLAVSAIVTKSMASTVATRPSTEGAFSAEDAVEYVHQMLTNR